MRNLLKYITLVVTCCLAASCAQDLGNYDYHDLAKPVVTGIDAEYHKLAGESLTIVPEIAGGLAETDYSYEWKVIDNNGDNEVSVLGNGRNLDVEVNLIPGSYTLLYTLTEKESGVYWQTISSLTVNTQFSEGWMVLCENPDGTARLDFISDVTGMSYEDILRDNGTPTYTGPRKIHWQNVWSDETSPYYLLADDGATRLGKDSFDWKEEYRLKYELGSGEDNVAPYSIESSGFGKIFVSGTDLYYSESIGISGLYEKISTGFNVSPYVGANIALGEESYASVYLLYDAGNKRFMAYCPMLETPNLGELEPVNTMEEMENIARETARTDPDTGVIQGSVTETGFTDYPEGYELVYMENTKYGQGSAKMGMTYSVLAKDGRTELYGIQLGDMLRFSPDCEFVIGKSYHGDLSSCTDIASASLFAFSSWKGMMYYAVGDKVYGVDLNRETLESKLHIDLEGETVTCLKFNLYKVSDDGTVNPESYNLVVAGEKDGMGTLRVYEGLESDGDFSGAEPIFEKTGFEKIADATYKELNY